jgi:hypothetical protein
MGKLLIQIGAGAGDRDPRGNYRDGFSEYVKKINPAEIDRIILVEPNPMNIEELKLCWKDYPQAEILQIGICAHTPKNSIETFYLAEEDLPHYQVFSIKEAHVRKHYPNGTIRSIDVEIYSINQFLEKFVGDTRIDIIGLDIEGIDAETILAVRWNQLNCFQISFEHLHLGDLGTAVLRHLGNSGYMYVGNGLDANGFDFLYEKIQK